MKNLYVFPYKMGSKSASNLSEALLAPQIKHSNSKFRGASFKTVINWGSSELPSHVTNCRILNKPGDVTRAGNKLSFFESISHGDDGKCRLVPWTTNKSEAEKWLKDGQTVVVRQVLTGHSGRGILIVEPDGPERKKGLPDAPFYTKYVPKDSEWRLHILRDKVIFRQRKVKSPAVEEPKTWKVRSHDNGFIFQHNGLTVPKDVEVQALAAFKASGLDFGGVDVIFNKKANKAYVLEINTACGLEGTTVGVYADAFREVLSRGA
jgi:glutathione synthase/RimK-type ligase-like ATP-grasp enzyme